MSSRVRSRSGFTLIETLVAMLPFILVLGIASSLLAFGTRVFSRETTGAAVQQDLIGAKNLLLDDLSIAGYRPDDLSGPFDVLPTDEIFDDVALGTSLDALDFRGDVTTNGTTDRVCYRVLNGDLLRAVVDDGVLCSTVWLVANDGEEEALLSGIQVFDLLFLDGSRANVAESDVEDGSPRARFVQATITVQENVKGGIVSRTTRGETALRN